MKASPALYNWHGLARELGMSVARAKREVSLDEFEDWMVFFKLEKERNSQDNGIDR